VNYKNFFIHIFTVCTILCIPCLVCSDQKELNPKEPLHKSQTKNSSRIVFSSYVNGNWQIQSIDPDGKNLTQLTNTEQELHYPACSPDGSRIACAGNERNIWVIKPGNKPQKLQNLPANCNHPAWSSNGDKIAFVCYTFDNRNENSDIWIADLKAGDVRKLMKLDNIQSFPAWSPDGKNIVFTSGYRVSSSKIIEALWLANSDGTNARPLISDGFYNIQPTWSPDGKNIAFASSRSGNMDIWVVNKDGTNARQLTFDKSYDADPSWSPDGTKMCFTSTRSGQMEIWVMDSHGKSPGQLTGLSGSQAESMHPFWHN
jgi:TolB protein